MTRRRPTVLLVMGVLGLVLGIAYLIWLVAAHKEVLYDLFFAGIGDPVGANKLAKRNMASPLAIYATTVSFFLELVLTLILLWTASGLINRRPSARWSAVFYAIFMLLVGTFNVIMAVFVLTRIDPVEHLLAVVARGVIVLFAIVLWGTMFLPSVTAVYAGGLPAAGRRGARGRRGTAAPPGAAASRGRGGGLKAASPPASGRRKPPMVRGIRELTPPARHDQQGSSIAQ